jgi:hypothetical protein
MQVSKLDLLDEKWYDLTLKPILDQPIYAGESVRLVIRGEITFAVDREHPILGSPYLGQEILAEFSVKK